MGPLGQGGAAPKGYVADGGKVDSAGNQASASEMSLGTLGGTTRTPAAQVNGSLKGGK